MVDAAMHRRPPQPVRQVRRGLNGRKSLVELQENLLSQVFGQRPVRKEVPANAEDHALVFAHDLRKSPLIALRSSPQDHFHSGFRFRAQGPLWKNNTQENAIRMQAFISSQALAFERTTEAATPFGAWAHLGIVTPETAIEIRLAKSFRTLIPPGRAQRLAQKCDRVTALSSVAALDHVVRDLS
jgi:hypothetical protein